MLKTAIDFLAMIEARLLKADARRNLESYLKTYIRSNFLEKIKIDSMLNPLIGSASHNIGHDIDGSLFQEDLVDMFIDEGGGDKIQGLLLGHAEDRGLTEKDAEILVHRGNLTPELSAKIKDVQDEFGKIIYSYLREFFKRSMLKWVGEHKDELPESEGEHVGVLPEHEIDEQIKQEYEWEEGLIKDVIGLINEKIPANKRAIYKMILRDRILRKKNDEKSQEALEKDTGVSQSTLQGYERDLMGKLRKFLKAQGLGPKFDLADRGAGEAPPYEAFMRENKDKVADLKAYLKDSFKEARGQEVSDVTYQVLDLLSEGKSISEVVSLVKIPNETARKIKSRYFNANYEEWYRDMVEDIRKASYRMTIQAAIKHHYDDIGKGVEKELAEKEPISEKMTKGPTRIHEKMVEGIFDHNKVSVEVTFSADFDSTTTENEGKDAGFKWLHYRASIDHASGSHAIKYEYDRGLTAEGHFDGSAHESLEVDGVKITEDSDLFKDIRSRMSEKILKEGVIPHGHFPVSFKNKKTGKEYHGVTQFKLRNHGIFIPDPVHMDRINEEARFKERKEMGPMKDIADQAKIHKLIFQLERDIKKEYEPSAKARIKDHIIQLKGILKSHGEGSGGGDFQDILKMIKDEKMIRHPQVVQAMRMLYAAVMPGPKNEDAIKLMSMFNSYGLTERPNPRLWLEPSDLRVLARALKATVELKMEKELKAKKPVGMSKEDWAGHLDKLRKDYSGDIEIAEKLFPEFIKDLKVRRDEYAKQHPLDYKSLESRKNVSWIDNEVQVDRAIAEVIRELKSPLKVDKDIKEPGVHILERTKFNALRGYLEGLLEGFHGMGDKLAVLGLKPGKEDEASRAGLDGLRAEKARLQKEFGKIKDETYNLSEKKDLSDEEKDILQDLKKEQSALTKGIRDLDEGVTIKEAIPAITGAKMLERFARIFSKFYSDYTRILWFREKYAVDYDDLAVELLDYDKLSADEVVPKEDKKKVLEADLPALRDKIVTQCRTLSKLHIKAKDEIKSGVRNLRDMLEKFLGGLYDVQGASALSRSAAEEREMSPEHKERYVKYVLPADFLHHGQSMIEKMKQHANKKVQALAPIAEKEFREITHTLAKVYKEGFTDEEIERMAKKKGISPQKAAIQLHKHRDAMNKAALDGFIIAWSDVLTHAAEKMPLQKQERSPLGNKPAEEYERLGKFLEDHVPEIFSLAPSDDGPKEPSAGVPTPKDIREDIERLWSIEKDPTPEEIAHLWKIEADQMGFGGGGGGGKGRSRAKVVRPNPPSGVIEQIKAHIADMVKHQDPEDVILTILMSYVHRIKKEIAGLKEDEYLSVDDVIDGMVHLLKQFHMTLLNLKVHPSAKQFTLPPPGAPQYTGTPDIPIDSYKDVQDVFDKYKSLIGEINYYLEPHKIGIPPASLKSIQKVNRYLPSEFADWAQWYIDHEKKGPARPGPAEYKPLPHIPGGAELKMKEKPKYPSSMGKPSEEYGDYSEKKSGGESLSDYPTQLSYNIAAKFAGMELSDDEFTQVMS